MMTGVDDHKPAVLHCERELNYIYHSITVLVILDLEIFAARNDSGIKHGNRKIKHDDKTIKNKSNGI